MIIQAPMAAVSVIVLSVFLLLSVFGSWILPDNTPDANRQIPELPLLKAFETREFLVNNQENLTQTLIPVRSKRIHDNKVEVERILSPSGSTITESYEKEKVEFRTITFYLGTDALGRDIFSRLILGIKTSLLIGFFSVMVSCVIGIVIGLIAGYFGGWIDLLLTTFINSMWSIPTILLVFALVLAIGRGVENIILAIGLTMWIDIARLVRGLAKSIKQKDYVLATKALSYGDARILGRHILPNTTDPLIVLATANFATAILVEAGISYLGFGIQPPAPSVGILLSENYAYVLGGHYLKAIAPAVVIVLMVLALNIIGTALRDRLSLDVKGVQAG